MIISHKYRFIFVKTMKTGGTSLEVELSQVCGPQDVVTPIFPSVDGHVPRNHRGPFNPVPELAGAGPRRWAAAGRDLIVGRRFYNHMAAHLIRARIGASTFERYFTFTIERNPWDKALSDYAMQRDRRGGELTFDEYLADGVTCRNVQLYCHPERPLRPMVDRVVRYENLEEELHEVLDDLGVPFAGLRVRAKSGYRPAQPYREFLTPDQATSIAAQLREEIDLHGYEY